MLLAATIWLLVSCSLFRPSFEQVLLARDIDRQHFLSLSTCEQIRIFSQVGSQFLDRGHFTVIAPPWVDAAIEKNQRREVAECIAQEGSRQLELLERTRGQADQISLSIHALVYKAYDMNLFKYPQIQEFLNQVICNSETRDSYTILLIYYESNFDLSPNQSEDLMKANLCN